VGEAPSPGPRFHPPRIKDCERVGTLLHARTSMGLVNSVINSIAFPRPPPGYSEADLLRQEDLVFIRTQRGLRVPAIHRRAKRPGPRYTVIYSHGNAEDVGLSLSYIDALSRRLDADVLAYEYPGYSVSDGEPSEAGVYESASAAWHYLERTCGVPPEGIVLLGRSLGSAPTVYLAARQPRLAGMMLQSPLASGLRVIAGNCAALCLRPCDPFGNIYRVKSVECPSVVIHGKADDVVPYWNGLAMHRALQQMGLAAEPMWVEGRGHNDMPEDRCVDHMRTFMESLPPPPPETNMASRATAEI